MLIVGKAKYEVERPTLSLRKRAMKTRSAHGTYRRCDSVHMCASDFRHLELYSRNVQRILPSLRLGVAGKNMSECHITCTFHSLSQTTTTAPSHAKKNNGRTPRMYRQGIESGLGLLGRTMAPCLVPARYEVIDGPQGSREQKEMIDGASAGNLLLLVM